jgi:molybdenum cofactor cytidylyltransferase
MSSESGVVGAILLAAGSSERLGQPKQLLPWRGQTLLRHAAEVTLASGVSPIVVVLGSRADEMATELNGLDVHKVVNPVWQQGMGSSLRSGLIALFALANLDAVLVLLCDQPLVTPDYLDSMIARYHEDPRLAVASKYEDSVLGPPCLFSKELFPRLQALSGAQGARALLGKLAPDQLSVLPFPDGLTDVDTWEDWERLRDGTKIKNSHE